MSEAQDWDNTPIAADERAAIVSALKGGQRAREVAESFDRCESTIRKIAKAEGIKRANSGRPPFTKQPPKEYNEVNILLPRSVFRLLEAAAKRRIADRRAYLNATEKDSPDARWRMTANQLAGQILVGVLTRGSIDKPPGVERAVEMSDDYETRNAVQSREGIPAEV